MRGSIKAILVVLLALQGCASVQLERGKDVSAAGIAYTEALDAVIDLAIDGAIDRSSESHIIKQMKAAATPEERAERTTTLKTSDDELVTSAQLYTRLRRSVGALRSYFVGLGALAGAKPAEATEAAVKNLAERINGLNATLERSHPISKEKSGAIAALAKQVVRQAHGAAVGHALERDAETIGRALALQELTLETARRDIGAAIRMRNDRLHRERVLAPFLAGGIGSDWAADRRTALRVRALGSTPEALDDAQAAARQMQVVWARVLSGELSADELLATLRDMQELLDAAVALKQADKKG